jgi:hypothetical protein
VIKTEIKMLFASGFNALLIYGCIRLFRFLALANSLLLASLRAVVPEQGLIENQAFDCVPFGHEYYIRKSIVCPLSSGTYRLSISSAGLG